MPSTEKLMEDIATSKFWMRLEGGYAPTGQRSQVPSSGKLIYTEDDFAAIDPRLPAVLAELSDNFTSDIITSVLEYWQGPQLKLPKLDDDDICVTLYYPVRYIHNIQVINGTSQVQVRVDVQKFRTTVTDTEFPWGTYRKELFYEKSLIDNLLPGWEGKNLTADVLGLSLYARTSYITGHTDTAAQDMSSILPLPTFE